MADYTVPEAAQPKRSNAEPSQMEHQQVNVKGWTPTEVLARASEWVRETTQQEISE